MTDDPERLVADALRAHAARTPLPGREPDGVDLANPVLGRYGLISGSGVPLPPADPPTVRARTAPEQTSEPSADRRLSAGWVLVLALLLGLAAGAVIGLLTLL